MNKNFWNLYKNSDGGKNAISLFTINENDNLEEKIRAIYSFCGKHLTEKVEIENAINRFFLITDNIFLQNLIIEEKEDPTEYFNVLIDNLELNIVEEDENGELFVPENEKPIIKRNDYKSLCSLTSDLSLVLFIFSSNTFFPILFSDQFDVFIKILDVLEISMPELPPKSDKRQRMLFYNSLNKNIQKFANENELTPEETCACIYDFASILQMPVMYETELPEPTNIWLTGGSKEDYKTFLKNPVNGATSVWTCNENTRRGDIIVMYVLSPYSCIQSIWRAEIDGVYTPFNYYNSRTRVTNGIVLPHVTLNELKADPYFSKLPITRKNFQGVNGVQFSVTDYSELQRLLKDKGFDVSVLPQLYNLELEFLVQLNNEKDVEEKLLIPLLEKLGYSNSDWSRQLSQKAGRNEKAIPDFVFLPNGENHFQNAPMVIEAKFNMSSTIERTKSYNQALSYARLMKSSTFGICDKDRIVIYSEKNGHFDRFTPAFEKHWPSINDTEIFRQLKLLIGKEAIKQKS